MSKYRYGLTTFGFLLVIVFSCIFGDYFCGIVDGGLRSFSILEIVSISLTVLVPSFAFYVKEKIANKAKPSWIVFILLLLLMGCGIYGIWATPNGTINILDASFEYEVDTLTRVTWTLGMVFTFITFYLMIVIWSKRFASLNWLRLIYFIIILVGVAAIVYSIMFDKEEYELLFKGEDNFYPYINSFFENKNTFGQFMLMCIISCIVLDSIKPHWWHIFYILLFLGFAYFSTAMTSIVVSHCLVLLFYLYKLIASYKKHPIRNSLLLGGVVFILVGIVGIGVILYYAEYKPVFRFGNFLVDVFDKDFSTATSRTKVWKAALETLQTPMQWAFGYGYRNFNFIFHNYFLTQYKGPTFAVDNTFIQLIGSFGLVGTGLYFGLLGLFGFALIYPLTKKKYKISVPLMIVSFCMLIYSIFETSILFEASLVGLLLFLMIILPGLIEFNKASPKRDVVRISLLRNTTYEFPKRWSDKTVTTFVSVIYVTLLLMVALSNSYFEVGYGIIGVLLLSWIFVAPLFGIWSRVRSLGGRISLYVILPILLYGLPGIGCYVALTYRYTFKAAVLGYFYSFLIILFIEYMLTCLIMHSFKESWYLFIHGALCPLIIPTTVHFVGFMIVNSILFYYGLVTPISLQLGNVVVQMLFILLTPSLVNLKRYRWQFRYIKEDLNTSYLARQRAYLLKDFEMQHIFTN